MISGVSFESIKACATCPARRSAACRLFPVCELLRKALILFSRGRSELLARLDFLAVQFATAGVGNQRFARLQPSQYLYLP